MTAAEPMLIVLRGNSASGKTTLAAALQRRLGRGTANIGQDHVRRVMLRERDMPDGLNIRLIDQIVRHCLAGGYDVILEGILVSSHYGTMLQRLVDDHQGPVHLIYLDVPLAETLRRHEGRPLSRDVSADEVTGWFIERDALGIPQEVILEAGALSEADTVEALLHIVTSRG